MKAEAEIRHQTVSTPPSAKGRYRPEIDGLRAFAVVAVIINHFNKDILTSGYLGVDIFFVISGYVITSSLADRESKTFGNFLAGFYERRIKRLVPALVLFVLITSILICLFNPRPSQSLDTGITSLFGFSNLYLFKQSTDYFAQSTELNPLTHTWSLGVEEQFYFLFPFLIWFSGFGRQTAKGARNLFLAVGALSIASLVGFTYLYQTNQPAAYFLMPPRFWELGLGCLVFLGLQKRQWIAETLEKVPPLLVLAAMVGVLFLPLSAAVPATISIVVLSALLICCLRQGTRAFQFFTLEKVVYVGLISYSLYLWHWGVLSISRWTIGIHWWSVPFQAVLMVMLAVGSYRWVEMRLRRNSWFSQRWKTLVGGFGTVSLAGLCLVALGKPLKGYLYAGKNQALHQNRAWDTSVKGTQISGKVCNGGATDSADQISNLLKNCHATRARRYRRTVAFIGDSHALSLMSAERQIIDDGDKLIHYSFSGCPFPAPRHGLLPRECNDFLGKAEDALLRQLSNGDIVVVLNYHLSHLGDRRLRDVRHNIFDNSGNLPDRADVKRKIYKEAMNDFAEKAKSKGIRIVLIGAGLRDNLIQQAEKEWFRPFPPNNFVLQEEEANARELNRYFQDAFKDVENIEFFDPLKHIPSCCHTIDQFKRYFRDSDHYSEYGANVLMKNLRSTVLNRL